MDARRGTKRKRVADDDPNLAVRRKLHHELKEVKKAAKRAKTLELMKVIKRLKFLRSKENNASELEDLEAQLRALKCLDIEIVANTAFKTRIRKRKLLCSNEYAKMAMESEIGSNILSPAEPGSPPYKAQSKLLSSKTLAEQVTSSVQAVELTVFPQDEKNGIVIGKQPQKVVALPKTQTSPLAVQANTSACETVMEAEAGWESGSVNDVENEWESGSVEAEVDSDASEDEAATPSSDEDGQDDTESRPDATKVSGLQSTFLPSLSVGFVRGDSDDSDLEADADTVEPAKKNRRGQRARRAIWEKKYGRNANHKKKEMEQQRPSERKQKTYENANKRRGQGYHVQNSNPNLTIDKSTKYAKPSAPCVKHEQPLHPSWEAKKQMREKMKPNIIPSQGKKIVF